MTGRRNLLCVVLTLIAVLSLGANYASAQTPDDPTPQPTPIPIPIPACATASFAPEVITYYGNSSAVMDKIENAQMSVENRRAYMILIETKDSAELSFFERHGKETTVRHWSGKSAGDFREVAADLILKNRGIACIGEQLKHVVMRQFNPENLGDIPVPVSLRSAFGHAIQQHGSQYMRVTAFLLC